MKQKNISGHDFADKMIGNIGGKVMKYFMNNSYELLQMAADCSDNMLCPQKLYLDVTQDCNLWCI